ncbi:CRISPR-associated RAMP protein, Cmr6 family [Richelia sinica FACHB-800]|uniref:CRISPR-associated RAMP protein, Cmr6 family n=1 Tax=Richelia sinica FACHB-800 TaxID=1357546 RepID=A0A975Y7C5_9NOST|nr:RAMP superfamily CRISPR-associated protein [Richelia sinica]MBD2666920.1 type III-B CRISPR module RAMP protein Cmr6 [Richelia sinica FACHB-800]QXE26188.1 CRISPR-associated RAMP protein, Cmr6 family [Richelia sinica FACHB-800]
MPPIPHNFWVKHPLPQSPELDPSASFVEYLRWLRIRRENPDNNSQIGLVNNGEVLELLAKIEQNSNYSSRLRTLTTRTRQLATVSFSVKAPWRIRVGGMNGPESMLLPAFDALGMPYIPSTTLKGVAREMAERDTKTTPEDVRNIFGDLEPTASMGKVIFLDAYPLPFKKVESDDESGDEAEGLVPDMANSIWTWDNNDIPQYKTNPNIFLSLRKPTFVIGLRVTDDRDLEILKRVKKWLLQGLTQGIGSRVNSGYGVLEEVNPNEQQEKPKKRKLILSMGFELQGQLMHGRQKFDQWKEKEIYINGERRNLDEWKPPGMARPEVRPPAFRSMLRYWFRTLALGVLPEDEVKEQELILFGGIDPEAKMGLLQIEIPKGGIIRDNAFDAGDDFGLAKGVLILRTSYVLQTFTNQQRDAVINLIKSLTWLMFHLGGVGQGARRPCYSRSNRNRPQRPYWRGSTLKFTGNNQNWQYSNDLAALQGDFQKHLNAFYTNLSTFSEQNCYPHRPRQATVTGNWTEAVDGKCRILCVQGNMQNDKPPALALLHQEATREGNGYNRQLCGSINERSPIWIARINNSFDVVTIFGVDNRYRKRYFELLTQPELPVTECKQIWPLPQR